MIQLFLNFFFSVFYFLEFKRNGNRTLHWTTVDAEQWVLWLVVLYVQERGGNVFIIHHYFGYEIYLVILFSTIFCLWLIRQFIAIYYAAFLAGRRSRVDRRL